MASLEQKLRDLVGRWYMSGGDYQFVNGLSQAARDVEQLLDQHEAEMLELVEQVNQASDKIEAEAGKVTEPSDLTEDERVTLLDALANVDPYTAPGTAIQAVGGALAWLVAHVPTKQQLAAMVGAFADEIEKQEKPPPGTCPTCGHINILGKVDHAGLMAWDSLRGLTFARREPPPPPTWTSITDRFGLVDVSGIGEPPGTTMIPGPTAKCTRCDHQLGTHSARACHAPDIKCTCTGPTTAARCVAHGEPGCAQCSLNPGSCVELGELPGCATFALSGVHWDTCPNRVAEILPNGDWRLTTDDVIEKANQP